MVRRHPLPATWLFSDERLAADMATLTVQLPPGSGIVLRHDSLPLGARWRLLRRLVRVARARGLVVLLADSPDRARRWGVDGVHLRQPQAARAAQARRLGLMVSMPVHDAHEAGRARRVRADIVFISPLHPTRSHPGAAALGHAAWLRLARRSGAAPVALGGMTAARGRALRLRGGYATLGWAAIDAWDALAEQRRQRRR